MSHPALDAIVGGIRQGLADEGYTEGDQVEYRLVNAAGDPMKAAESARELADEGAALLVAVSSVAANAVVREVTDVPVVFAAVSSAAAAGVTLGASPSPGNVTGVLDRPPVESHLDLLARLVPAGARLGLLYDTTDPISVGLAHREAAAARVRGFSVTQVGAGQPGDVLAAAQSLSGQVDVISIVGGSPVLAALESLLTVTNENGIPVLGNDADSVRRGAVAAYSVGYEEHGRQAGGLAARILAGGVPSDIPVQHPQVLELTLNSRAAAAVGLELPADLVAAADQVY